MKSEANCEDKAVYYFSCSCGAKGTTTFTDGELADHTPDTAKEENRVEATCKDAGSYDEVVYCSVCGDELSRVQKTVPSTGHTFGEWTVVQDSTCTVNGMKVRVCVCKEKETEVITANGHSFGGWIVESVATCVTTGTKHRVCSACDESESDTIPVNATAHNYSTILTSDDTHHWYKCLNNGCTSMSDKTSHSFGEWIVDNVATCMKTGTRHHICSICQKSVSEAYSDPDAHSYDDEWTVDDIYHWHTCLKCNSITDKKGHLIDDSGKCSLCGHQTTPSTDGIVYMISEDGTYAEVVDYTASETSVIIAATYKGVPVTKIGNSAFAEKGITSISIPNSITSIEDGAFRHCRNLTSVTIGNSVTSIGTEAFSCCAITNLTIPDSVTSIGLGAFYANSSLANVKIGNGVTVIGMYAFKGCGNLISVTVPDNVERIEEGAFSDCFSLTRVTLGDNVTYIGNAAFYFCSNLTNITIPDSLTTVGRDAFYACSNVMEKVNGVTYVKKIVIDVDNAAMVELREGTKVIAADAFIGCSKLRKVTIPDSVVGIGSAAFLICENLESVTMSNNLKIIGDRAFHLCKNLSSIVIPDSVTSIEFQAFSGCSDLTSIKYCGTETQWEAISKGLMWDDGTNYTITYNYTNE